MQTYLAEYRRLLPAVVIETQVINEDIAHHIDAALLCPLAVGDAVVAHAGGEEEVGQSVDDKTIYLFWHLDVERAGACHEMCQLNTLLLGHYCCSHCGSKVVNDNHHIGRIVFKIMLKGTHHLARYLVKADAIDIKENVRTRYLQVAEERALERRVIATSCINKAIADVVGLVDGAY